MKNFFEALAEAIAGLCFIGLIIGLMVLGVAGRVLTLQNEVESVKKEYKETSSIEGEISKIENYTGPNKIVENRGGDVTLTLTVSSDRTKIHFKDGRSKEFIGMPTKPIETGKYYKITYHKHNILGEITEVPDDKERIREAPARPDDPKQEG